MKTKIYFWLTVGALYLLLAIFLVVGMQKNSLMLLATQLILLGLLITIVYFYKQIIRPIEIITTGADLLKEQDFSSRLSKTGQHSIDKLIEIFNKMMEQLKEERLRVREQHYFLDLLIKASPMAVIILDFDQRISSLNPAAERIFSNHLTLGKPLHEVQHPLAKEISELKINEQKVIRLNGIHAYKCTRSYFIDRGFQHPFILLEELTQEFIKAEKKAYEKVIRIMSHEVNNAIGATNSMLSLLSDNLRRSSLSYSEDFCSIIDIATERGKNLSLLMSNFSDVVKIPEPSRKPVSITALIDSVRLSLEAECRKREIAIHFDIPTQLPPILADVVQMEQVLINIVKNSIESIEKNGTIRISAGNAPLSLSVEDNGKGISPEEKSMLFTPFYSTKPNGQGIGLMFVREIILNHHYQLSLETNDNGITVFTITFTGK